MRFFALQRDFCSSLARLCASLRRDLVVSATRAKYALSLCELHRARTSETKSNKELRFAADLFCLRGALRTGEDNFTRWGSFNTLNIGRLVNAGISSSTRTGSSLAKNSRALGTAGKNSGELFSPFEKRARIRHS